ncbi:DUF4430 domain-containing protein [Candidatus Falkowbacteria bacterium]|nr:DUF4430 domain-containing protein [Candidatus Falkowbacteria bacterium]
MNIRFFTVIFSSLLEKRDFFMKTKILFLPRTKKASNHVLDKLSNGVNEVRGAINRRSLWPNATDKFIPTGLSGRHFFVRGLFIALALIFSPILAVADIGSAVVYLQAQPQDAWITQALSAAGADNIATDHLTNVSGTSATDYAKAILALAAVGENPKTFGNIDYVAKLKTYLNNNQIGDESLLNDDIWSILALASVGEVNSNEAMAAKNYLMSNQNTDGGWGYAVNGDSDTNDTAAAIMALVEAGISVADSVIVNAVNYLELSQNNDGGFPYDPASDWGTDSDSGSDSWVISALYKIGQNPADWDKNNNNPISHLESLQDAGGGFWWVEPGTSEWNNKAMTAYAVIALSGKSFPVGYWTADSGDYHLRIEGQNNMICDVYVAGDTALEVVENAAEICGYSYVITDSSFGSYLSQINNESGSGMIGWMYFVNYESPLIGAADYTLSQGDEVLWYYGEWGWQPARLSVSANNLATGRSIAMTVEYFDGQAWNALQDAVIKGGDQDYTTDASGQAMAVLPDGYYNLFAEKDSFIRSNQEEVFVGDGISQNIALSVEIIQSENSNVAGESIIFEISASRLDFGKMKPGDAASQSLDIINSGTVDLTITASVSGDLLFLNNLRLDNQIWQNFGNTLAASESKEVNAELNIPENYFGSGIKTGELIFWAR